MTAVFFSYSHKDEALRDELEVHLSQLKNQGLIDAWHDRRIVAGDELDSSISERLESDEVILLLVSPDFLASNYCYSREMASALARHDRGEAQVIPVILRHCDWLNSPLAKLKAVPRDGKPVKAWPDIDEALADVAREVRAAVEKMQSRTQSGRSAAVVPPSQPFGLQRPAVAAQVRPAPATQTPRSSNLRLTREFSEKEQDDFLRESFEYIFRFFETSLAELKQRADGVDGHVERVDTRSFVAVAYRHGSAIAQCAVRLGGGIGGGRGGIRYSQDASMRSSDSYNEELSVVVTDQALHLRSLGLGSFQGTSKQLSQDGGAELLWGMFIAQAQHRDARGRRL